MKPYEEELGAAQLRQLAEQKRQEQAQEIQKKQQDALWNQKRAELGPKAVGPAKADLVKRAKAAAQKGELSLKIDLGVDEKRLRASSGNAVLQTTEAVLVEKMILSPGWNHAERVGWLFQSHDGLRLTEYGQGLIDALRKLGFTVSFTPHHIKDDPANPYFNATLAIEW